MSLRHAALPLAAICSVYFGLQLLNTEPADIQDVADVKVAAYAQPAAVTTPVVHPFIADNQTTSLKSAFESSPVPSSVRFEESAAAKPVTVAAAPAAPKTLSPQITAIQTGLNTLLQAGTDILTSSKTLTVGKGDTLMELLVKNNVPREEAYEAILALNKIYDPRDLNPGHEITVFFNKEPSVADPKFSGLSIEKDPVYTVVVNRGNDGSYKVDQEEKEVARELKAFSGTIDGSLYMSAKAQGVPDGIILDLIKMYSFNVDFQRDIQPGDKFEVLYEEYKTEDGDVVPGKGHISYAKLSLGDRIMPFYRFTNSAGDVGYYDEKGQSAKRPLMKTPIDGARLSSGFGMRKHPVLGFSKMHKGVDFAAPRGTPIYAAGDGTIVKLGKFSSYGNYIRINHRSGIDTAYAHMNGYKAGLRAGSRVKQGQVIGYVGTTGRSTGPHLHFEVMMAGKQVNPSTIKMQTGNALAGTDLKAFKGAVAEVARAFTKGDKPASQEVASR